MAKKKRISFEAQAHSWKEMLRVRPIRNEAVTVEVRGEDVTVVTIKRKSYSPPLSWFVPVARKQDVYLDQLGSKLWEMCDGVRQVEEIVDYFSEKYHLTFHESRVAVTEYVQQLARRGVLVIAV